MQFTYKYSSPIGGITIASDGESLTGLWFDGQKYFANTLDSRHKEIILPIFEQTCEWLDIYFKGQCPGFTPSLHLSGTPFRMMVWEILQKIPYGETITYKEISEEIIRQKNLKYMSPQAVGGAVGHNPISIIVPCHRVVGSSGSLTGYAGGVSKKVELMKLEHMDTSVFFVPTQGSAL